MQQDDPAAAAESGAGASGGAARAPGRGAPRAYDWIAKTAS